MLKVELVYNTACPNVEDARAQLRRAFANIGLPPRWREWEQSDPETPVHLRAYGSPTILINGQDVADEAPSAEADCCRLYVESGRFRGVPSVEAIVSALLKAKDAVNSDAEASDIREANGATPCLSFPGLVLPPS